MHSWYDSSDGNRELFAFSSYTGKVKFEKLNAGSHFHPSKSTEYFLLYENLKCGLRWSFAGEIPISVAHMVCVLLIKRITASNSPHFSEKVYDKFIDTLICCTAPIFGPEFQNIISYRFTIT